MAAFINLFSFIYFFILEIALELQTLHSGSFLHATSVRTRWSLFACLFLASASDNIMSLDECVVAVSYMTVHNRT